MTLFSAALASASLASRPVRILRIAGLYPGQLSRTTSQCPHADGFNASNSSFDTDPFFINFRGSAMTTSTPPAPYFTLQINGLDYLRRIRDVRPKKGDSFLACAIAALNGPTTKPEYRYFDIRVSGDEA